MAGISQADADQPCPARPGGATAKPASAINFSKYSKPPIRFFRRCREDRREKEIQKMTEPDPKKSLLRSSQYNPR